MGRPERPLDPASGPVASFAHDLRLLRTAAGMPTYAAMARRAHRAASTLAEAAGGRSWPTLDTVLAYVTACDATPEALTEWERRWRQLDADLAARERQASQGEDADVAADPSDGVTAPAPPPRAGHTGPADHRATRDPGDRAAIVPAAIDVGATEVREAGPSVRGRGLGALTSSPGRLVAIGGVAVLLVTLPVLGARFLGPGTPGGRTAAFPAVTSGTTPSPSSPSPSPSVSVSPSASPAESLTIVSPADGATVPLLSDVTIRRTGTTPGEHVWITIVFEGGVVVNPQGPCDTADAVTYTCAKAQFADPESKKGTTLHLRAVLVDEEGNLALESLVASGYSAKAPPVPFLTQSPVVVVRR